MCVNWWCYDTPNGYISTQLIGNGQEVALIAGSADIITGREISVEDITAGLENGTLIASRSFALYDGTANVARFEADAISGLMESGDEINFTRIDALTYEQLGGSGYVDPNLSYDLNSNEFSNSLSAQNGNDFGSIISEDPTLGLI